MYNIQATVDNVVYSDFYLKHLKLIQYIYIYKFIYEIKALNKIDMEYFVVLHAIIIY